VKFEIAAYEKLVFGKIRDGILVVASHLLISPIQFNPVVAVISNLSHSLEYSICICDLLYRWQVGELNKFSQLDEL
ncbi:hypothetical protein Csa_011082, partial [Cucumis sativus]